MFACTSVGEQPVGTWGQAITALCAERVWQTRDSRLDCCRAGTLSLGALLYCVDLRAGQYLIARRTGAGSESRGSKEQVQTAGPPAPPQVLFRQLKFRNYPFEWVYDGLDPALLHKVVYRRKGMPLTLGALYLLVGARLGIPLEMKGQPPPPIQLPTGPPLSLSHPLTSRPCRPVPADMACTHA